MKYIPDLRDAAPEMVTAFFNFDKVVFNKNVGSLSLATRELIAMGVEGRGCGSNYGGHSASRWRWYHAWLAGDEEHF
ncbi:hypothetical protein H7Q97_18970 [Ochrobactrum sp. CM-21-5]|nr:hypothetical protein [Ochrobactrum sp. CM-21-5]MBC2887464.1 hypothetical protein [Ochrobactrum sp. CM-21-5]